MMMRKLRPFMGSRRQRQIDNVLSSWIEPVRPRLTENERETILLLHKQGLSQREIASQVNRHHRSIERVVRLPPAAP